MNATTAALVWCVIQVTVLTCGVAVVYLAARRVHPRSGAAAAAGGLLMVIALTALAASPWPRWIWTTLDGAGAMREVVAGGAPTQPAVMEEMPKAPVQEIAVKPMDVTVPAPSFWSLLLDAIDRPRHAMGSANESAAELGATRWAWLVMSLFAVGGLVAAARLAWGVSSVRRLAREGLPVDDSRLLAIVNDLRQRLELADTVDVRESDQLATPATIGWRWQVVMLPPAWRAWSDAELRAVIAHELAHIAGRDYAAWFVARLALVAHFYHPLVRWLAARLQLEQELAADMAAARVVGDPKQYLHSLAALALATPPHRMAGPARTLFPSRSLLVRRVEMLRTTGMSRPRRGAARYATFAMVAIVGLAAAGLRGPGADLATSALAQARPDAQTTGDGAVKTEPTVPVERTGFGKPPSIEKIIADLKSNEEAIETLQTTYVCLDKFNFVKPGSKPPAEGLIEDDAIAMTRKATVSWEVARDGRARMEAAIRRMNERADGTTFVRDEEIISTFDGSGGQWLESQKTADGTVSRRNARGTTSLRRTHDSPFEFTTQHLGVPISKLLTEGQASIVEMQSWEGRPVIVIETKPDMKRVDYISRRRFWIDVDRRAVVRRQIFEQRGERMPWGLHHQVDAAQFAELSPDLWLPKNVQVRNYVVTDKGQDFLVSRTHYEITSWTVNQEIDSSRFKQDYTRDTIDADRLRPGQPVPSKNIQ